jgi:NAD(P)-dependent dehydrogenase (short-subunit alcohol dehydrogenase family)
MVLRFDGRVAIVTGAGSGLGRSYALSLAERGAAVVVNDLGGATDGHGADASVAESVARDIRERGGQAVANTASVENGSQIVEQAMDTYGRIDVLVNNAGILRNNSFRKMTDEDWDLVYKVHLLGSYKVSHAAWPHMRNARFGRIVMITSGAGLYGTLGAANYSAAKAGIVGLAQALALEGASANIRVNSVGPFAASRLTSSSWPDANLDALRPEQVAPLVVLLTHEDCEITGRIFEVGGGHVLETRWDQSAGTRLPSGFTAEALQAAWPTAMFTTPGTTSGHRWAELVSGPTVPGLLGRD